VVEAAVVVKLSAVSPDVSSGSAGFSRCFKIVLWPLEPSDAPLLALAVVCASARCCASSNLDGQSSGHFFFISRWRSHDVLPRPEPGLPRFAFLAVFVGLRPACFKVRFVPRGLPTDLRAVGFSACVEMAARKAAAVASLSSAAAASLGSCDGCCVLDDLVCVEPFMLFFFFGFQCR